MNKTTLLQFGLSKEQAKNATSQIARLKELVSDVEFLRHCDNFKNRKETVDVTQLYKEIYVCFARKLTENELEKIDTEKISRMYECTDSGKHYFSDFGIYEVNSYWLSLNVTENTIIINHHTCKFERAYAKNEFKTKSYLYD